MTCLDLTFLRYIRRITLWFVPAIIIAGCGSEKNATIESLHGPADALTIYKQRCMQCHGDELQGWMGTSSNLQKIGQRLSKADIINTIENGGKRMPALGNRLDKTDIEKVADWLAGQK